MYDLIGIISKYIVNIFPQQFLLKITRTFRIEFVELLHYLMNKTHIFRFSVRFSDTIAWKEKIVTAVDFFSCRTFLFFPHYDVICDLLS